MARGLLTIVLILLATAPANADSSAEDVAAKIDRLLEARAPNIKVQLADDAEFLRRISLDLIGRIPTSSQVHVFLSDKRPDKRRRIIDQLLDVPASADHFANVWRAMMLPRTNNPQIERVTPHLETWLRQRFRDNVPYDRMVRELLTTSVTTAMLQGASESARPAQPTPLAFFQANEMKPENLAAATSRMFLGVKLECAQCHDHPFARWKRQQFWEYSAFFAGIKPEVAGDVFASAQDDPRARTIAIPSSGKVVQAKGFDGRAPNWQDNVSTRATLAAWVTAQENTYFAEATVNKVWAHFFGLGIIDPIDEPGENNLPSHPEILQTLAQAFVANKYDLRYLFRVICSTKAYQLSSAAVNPDGARTFRHMAIKGLSPEQLFDSLALAIGYVDPTPLLQRGVPDVHTPRNEFLTRFASPTDRRTEPQLSILQALTLMNGQFLADATAVGRSRTLTAITEAPHWSNAERIEALFVASLSRPPRPHEAARFLLYVERGGPSGDQKQALADVFWVLLNCPEFIINH